MKTLPCTALLPSWTECFLPPLCRADDEADAPKADAIDPSIHTHVNSLLTLMSGIFLVGFALLLHKTRK